MVRLGNLLKRTPVPAALCALVLAACGSQQRPQAATTQTTTTPGNRTVWMYSSLPQAGPDRAKATQIRLGIELALGSAKRRTYHGFHVRYKPLNDSATRPGRRRGGAGTARSSDRSHDATTSKRPQGNTDGWNAEATVQNAEQAARNPQTIAYIGDLSSGATELSLPILNQAGIVQITPGSGYPGLTNSYKGGVTQQGEPDRYYPQSPRTLLRLIPDDTVQASAALSAVASSGCRHVAAWTFGKPSQPTTALLYAVKLTAPKYGMRFYPTPPAAPGPKQPANLPSSYAGYIDTLAPDALRCAVLVGHVTRAAVAFTAELRLLEPIQVVGTNGFCNRSWVRIPDTVSKANARNIIAGLLCTTPALPVTSYQGHSRFLAAFQATYHRQPDAYAYYGYEAAEMILKTLAQVGAGEDIRQQLVLDLVSGFATDVTGPFTFDGQGNVRTNGLGALAGYGIDNFPHGAPRFHRLVNPAAVLLPSAG